MKDYTKYLLSINYDIWTWTGLPLNTFILKKKDGGIAVISPNVESFGDVRQWQTLCYRLVSNVRIDGITFKDSDHTKLTKLLEKELNFLSSITVPER